MYMMKSHIEMFVYNIHTMDLEYFFSFIAALHSVISKAIIMPLSLSQRSYNVTCEQHVCACVRAREYVRENLELQMKRVGFTRRFVHVWHSVDVIVAIFAPG